MDIQCFNENDEIININIYFDNYGNLYLNNGIQHYQINVNNKNQIYAELWDTEFENDINYNYEELNISELMKNEEPDDYLYEDKDYFEEKIDSDEYIIDEDNINQFGSDNLEFRFMTNSDLHLVRQKAQPDVSALYDTFIYNNSSLLFCSKSSNEQSIFRIIIRDGIIFFRPIGYSEKQYKIIRKQSGELLLI